MVSSICLLSLFFVSCEKATENAAAAGPDLVFTVLTGDMVLQTINAADPGAVIKSMPVTGLISGEVLLGIDYRPATGQLYGLGNTSRIYLIDANGKATPLGLDGFTPKLSGIVAGFDFNPTVDRIRVVTTTGQNLRINPETGAVQNVDLPINGGASPQVSGVAYTNPVAGAATTLLYDLDVAAKKLYIQDPPNNGTLVEVGSVTIADAATESGFDISPSGVALASVTTSTGMSSLYQLDLTTGMTTALGQFATRIAGLAIPTSPVAYAVDETNNLIIFNPANTDQTVKAITGVQSGERIVGIDFRPATGQLYALGSTSRLYTVNLSSGVATQVGSMQLSTMLSGTSFGFDFNPTVDRIRVVSNTGQNLRLDPNTGLVAAVDLPLNPGTPAISAAAYTNNFPGAITTTLYDLDFTTGKLYMQNPPNNGVLVEVGSLGIGITSGNGFDIGGTSGIAYAVLTTGATTKLYRINLSTGAATAVMDFPRPVTGFSIGLGF